MKQAMKVKKYLSLTPAGAYYLSQGRTNDWYTQVLKKLIEQPHALLLNYSTMAAIFVEEDQNQLIKKIKACKKLKLIQVIEYEATAPKDNFEKNLAQLISAFSHNEKVLLSDSQGFCIVNHGFPEGITEEISVLSADIAAMHRRRALGIDKKLKLNSQAWSIVDASGNSCLGFWPLNINDEIFVLAIEGVPYFNQPAFVTLIWMLYLRYGVE